MPKAVVPNGGLVRTVRSCSVKLVNWEGTRPGRWHDSLIERVLSGLMFQRLSALLSGLVKRFKELFAGGLGWAGVSGRVWWLSGLRSSQSELALFGFALRHQREQFKFSKGSEIVETSPGCRK